MPSGQVSVSAVAAPRSGGTLELAEPAGGWTATLNGTALQSVPSPAGSWAQAFRLPAGGGTLDISHSQLSRTLIVVLEVLALLVVIALGLPGARVPGESAAAAGAERSRGRPPGARPREARRTRRARRWNPGWSRGACPARTRNRPGAAGCPAGRRPRAGPRAGRAPGRGIGTGRVPAGRIPAPEPGDWARDPAHRSAGRAQAGAARSAPPAPQRHENEDLDAFPGADLAMDAGAAAATGPGAAAGFGSDAARPARRTCPRP